MSANFYFSKLRRFREIKQTFLSIVRPRDISCRLRFVVRAIVRSAFKFLTHSSLDPPEPSIAGRASARTALHTRDQR